LATWPADGVTPKDIIAAADNALYQSKRNGGNQTRCSSVNLKAAIDSKNSPSGSQDSGTLSTIFALAATVDTRDRLTHDHSKKVHDLAVAIAEGMGLDALEINRLGTCALLHDIGKIGINDEVLQKQGKLTDMEWKMIKAHPALGSSIISHSLQLAPCIQGILHHHESFNGEGYPDGLKGTEIPLEARILAIADSFAAMTSARVYSKTLSCDEAIEEIKRASGIQFDPALVDIFVKVVPKINKVSGVESPNTQTINPV
jgi:HD-GYP domain-containing protein (c-di-GMP phosphodiesterase class II)